MHLIIRCNCYTKAIVMFYAASSIKRRIFLLVIIIVGVGLIGLRLYAPYGLERYINQKIDEAPGLSGSIGDVDLHLYRGAYLIESIALYSEKGRHGSSPLLAIDVMDLSVLWSALWRGEVVADVMLTAPTLTIRRTEGTDAIDQDAVKNEKTWIALVNQLVPFSIDQVDIRSGAVNWNVRLNEEQAALSFTDIDGGVSNITNSRHFSGSRIAHLELSGLLAGEAKLQLQGSYQPFSDRPTFDVDASVEQFSLSHLDSMIQVYAPFDVEAGAVDGAMELKSIDGKASGYVKVGMYGLEVFEWRADIIRDNDNPFQALFEGFTDLVSAALENDETDLVATKIPIEGDISSPDTPFWPTLSGLFRNAFIEAYQMNIDDIVEFSVLDNNADTNQ